MWPPPRTDRRQTQVSPAWLRQSVQSLLGMLGVLYLVRSRFRLHYGQLFFLWVAWYGLQRFVLDFLRFGMGDAEIGSFTWNQISGLVAGIGGLVAVWVIGRKQPIVSVDEDTLRGAVLESASA